MSKNKKDKDDSHSGTIALNKRAKFEYKFDERVEAGLMLQGWEVKSLRAGRANITDAYAIIRNGEMFLFGAQIVPLGAASTHVVADDRRTRKLLLHREEIDRLTGQVERKGYTLVPTALYWKHNRAKVELGLALGKKEHDKRDTIKDREWQIEKQRTMRAKNRDA
ncbi:MAG: SsrA-binding protein SmpB [Xanthomonadales bacterium]|jgi:SsrA-binding protein|nr:SsrA-binding protein SmpB [Xanthomonadales bacterium]MBK7146990.1 SsrA-binding protein SmpB [Xanthomonadales bacterium]